jgi:type I restriction-modification system DNA methylase subunit
LSKHVVLGLIFLKHVSNAFEAKHEKLLREDRTAAEDPDECSARAAARDRRSCRSAARQPHPLARVGVLNENAEVRSVVNTV